MAMFGAVSFKEFKQMVAEDKLLLVELLAVFVLVKMLCCIYLCDNKLVFIFGQVQFCLCIKVF